MWLVDSTPVGCGCSRETVKRSDLAGWAQYGYCASHSRYFWGLRLHLVCTLGGLPVLFALTGAKADERETLRDMLDTAPHVLAAHPGQTIIGDKNYFGREFEHGLAERHLKLLRPARKGKPSRPAHTCSNRCGRSSSRSIRPSRGSSTWNDTAARALQGCQPGSCAGSSHSQRRSGTTTKLDSPSSDHSLPTITDRNNTSWTHSSRPVWPRLETEATSTYRVPSAPRPPRVVRPRPGRTASDRPPSATFHVGGSHLPHGPTVWPAPTCLERLPQRHAGTRAGRRGPRVLWRSPGRQPSHPAPKAVAHQIATDVRHSAPAGISDLYRSRVAALSDWQRHRHYGMDGVSGPRCQAWPPVRRRIPQEGVSG